jgi:hypothetical protein
MMFESLFEDPIVGEINAGANGDGFRRFLGRGANKPVQAFWGALTLSFLSG